MPKYDAALFADLNNVNSAYKTPLPHIEKELDHMLLARGDTKTTLSDELSAEGNEARRLLNCDVCGIADRLEILGATFETARKLVALAKRIRARNKADRRWNLSELTSITDEMDERTSLHRRDGVSVRDVQYIREMLRQDVIKYVHLVQLHTALTNRLLSGTNA